MALNDEIKVQRQKLKGAPFKQKLSYFWSYYKGPFFISLLIVAFIVTYVGKLDDKKIILHGYMLNHFNNDLEAPLTEIEDGFLRAIDHDAGKYTLNINTTLSYYFNEDEDISTTNYQTMETLLAKSAGGELGFITGDRNSLMGLAYSDFFLDLTTIMNKEQIANFQSNFLYIDSDLISEFKNNSITLKDTSTLDYPDMTSPENMKKPVPVLIDISSFPTLRELYHYSPETLSFGVSSTRNPEIILQFLEYITAQ